ncbi:ATP-binding protein [Rhizorhabdus dicambivorans]|uniref:histidine kinase n=1 Tax=Rhizorhabdus dicambivorans TaxID=1850238 RepID=A0A2A4FWF1_9SPHN|nr:ATP-binding protein [Rhizorhabdus dicambivorans]ATE66139.1 hybrid sensor histidine kinase/response regulator [Rhizorhabdus dicambivorans]PCE42065.1 hybrid sensor histidine kinase/response regulator [Rhizorhabdus dicambivorans]
MDASRAMDDINAPALLAERWSLLASAIEQLGSARSLEDIVEILRSSARRIAGADGITVVLRDNGQCHYVAEDAKAPLWVGLRFPRDSCISGIAMRDRKVVLIPDVMADPRVPHAAYEPTFVRSMAMIPIGAPEAVAAIGAYWSDTGTPSAAAVALLHTLSRAATTALENSRLLASLTELNGALEARVVERTAQLERTQEMARQSQKMETIGQLTGHVAHDFNNLLTPIMGSLDLILARQTITDGVLRSVNVAMDAAERARLLVQRLLAFARRQPLAPSPVDLRDLILGMRNLLASSLGPRIALSFDVASDLPQAMGDRHQLEMALLNLAVNARDAMPEGGILSILADRGEASSRPETLARGDYVRVIVRDDGTGMDKATLARAVEPFFSTKDMGQGTGLGLSMVDGLVAQLGGTLEIHSTPATGTTVIFWLPVAREKAATPAPVQPAPEDDAPPGTVLVVDDESRVRTATASMLNALGYDTVEAGSAIEALDQLDDGLDPAIVITDHLMPGMTGAELVLRLREERPGLPVMIISGYQGVDLLAPDVVRVSKPFRRAHLSAGIAAAREKIMA